MIGNDVVDLDDDEAQPHGLHPRFDARVFAGGELEAIRASDDPHRVRWLLWAAKESAYKLLGRTLPDIGFSPRAFVVKPSGSRGATVVWPSGSRGAAGVWPSGPRGATVVWPSGPRGVAVEARGHVVRVDFECGKSFVHAVASYHGVPPTLVEIRKLSRQTKDPGAAARRLAIDEIASLLRVEARDLTVDRDGRMPLVLRAGRPLPGTLSLSHHGRYVACAWRSGVHFSRSSTRRRAGA